MRLSPAQKIKLKQHIKNILLIKAGVLLVLGVQYVVPRVQQRLFANVIGIPVLTESQQTTIKTAVGMFGEMASVGGLLTMQSSTGKVSSGLVGVFAYQGIMIPQVLSYQGLTPTITSVSNNSLGSFVLGVSTIRTNQPVSVISGVATSGTIISVSLSGTGFAVPLTLSSVMTDASGYRSVILPQSLDQMVVGSSYDVVVSGLLSQSSGNVSLRLSVPSAVVIHPTFTQSLISLVTTTL